MYRAVLAGLAVVILADAQTRAQAPRKDPKITIGPLAVSIEHGAPPWNDDRLNQLKDQLPVGAPWRMGAEGPTTIKLEGSDTMLGGKLVQPGTYLFNCKRVTDNDWVFLIAPRLGSTDDEIQISLDHRPREFPATIDFNGTPVIDSVTFEFPKEGFTTFIEMQFGPVRLRTTVAPVTEVSSEEQFNGAEASITWYQYPVDPARMSKAAFAAEIEMEIDNSDASLRLYIAAADGQITATFRNVEVEDYENLKADAQSTMKLIEQVASLQGGNADQVPRYKVMRRQITKADMMIDDLKSMPDRLNFSAAATSAAEPVPALNAKFLRAGRRCVLNVRVGNLVADIPIDESAFTPKGS